MGTVNNGMHLAMVKKLSQRPFTLINLLLVPSNLRWNGLIVCYI